jgi:hypothetical protein
MYTKIWLDDLRAAPDESWWVCYSSAEAIFFLTVSVDNGDPFLISFDHDLGGDDTSMREVNYLIIRDMDENYSFLKNFDFKVHSANPVGAENIRLKLENHLRYSRG